MERKLEISLTPHYHDNRYKPYFWVIFECNDNTGTWYNSGLCGWEETPQKAFETASKYIDLKEEEKMKESKTVSSCPFKIGDKVKLILPGKKPTLSDSAYTIEDILTVHSVKTGSIKFEVILKDVIGWESAPRSIDTIQRV